MTTFSTFQKNTLAMATVSLMVLATTACTTATATPNATTATIASVSTDEAPTPTVSLTSKGLQMAPTATILSLDDDTEEDSGISAVEVVGQEQVKLDESAIKSITQGGKKYTTHNLSDYAQIVNGSMWSPNMKVNSAMTVKLQVLLDWNHASPGPIDGGYGDNTKKALKNFQKIKELEPTGKMDEATWAALIADIDASEPVLVSYTLTKDDIKTPFAKLPEGAEARSKLKGLHYENIVEMLGERFHMDVAYLKKLNPDSEFKAGDTITVINTGKTLDANITRVHASIADKTLYAYDGDKLVATYPTTIGGKDTATPNGTFKVVNRVKMPWYKATVGRDTDSPKTYMLPPGPNSPVGVVWLGLSKPSYGIHGSPIPEGISRQASLGCVRLTNWDVLEVFDNIDVGAVVEIK